MTNSTFGELGKAVGLSLEETKKEMSTLIPLQRWGEAAEIAGTIAFMASDDASYMTGSSLIVDGGATIVEPATTSLLSKLPPRP
jgi:NAD(P)-dependent dehydrogenase (short-subunit alcohol dehydrogenase family)